MERNMKNGLSGIFIFISMCIHTLCGASETLHLDLDADHLLKLQFSGSYFETVYLETASVSSEHLDHYDIQDTERRHILKGSMNILTEEPNSRSIYSGTTKSLSGRVIDKDFSGAIYRVSQEFNIDPLLLHAIAEVESNYNASAVSHAGAQGLMQIMPDTARRFGMLDPEQELFNPLSNLRVSSRYIRSLHRLFGNNVPLILAAYNAGENAVIKYGYTVPPYKETRNYVDKVMQRYLELRGESVRM
ncbi:MAG: lytic transglycosylase domain-containing protein [Candidatus Thiodiazotropha sp.]